jgi:hypothetical protein
MKRQRYIKFFEDDFLNIHYLTNLYKQFNHQLFDNKLQEYPIVVKSLKNVGAAVKSIGIRNKPETWKIQEIVFSNQIIRSEDEIKGILLHEMIHVNIIENHVIDYGGMHGIIFRNQLYDLQKKVSFKIPESENITHKLLNPEYIKKKFVIAVLLNSMHSISVYNIKLKNKILDEIKEYPIDWLNKYKPIIIQSDNIQLLKYPVKSTFSRLHNYVIDENLAKEILNDSEILYQF